MADTPDLDSTRPLPTPTTAFSARFRLLAEIGRGGMGIVWRAEDTKLRREVALKFIPEAIVQNREAMADLTAETRRCLQLTHPHIVRVYDLIEEGERAAISMELVPGGSLAARKLAQPDHCFSPASLTRWVTQLCSALDYAHTKARLVHRDLKPLNLLLDGDDDLKVVDFGISRSLHGNATGPVAAGPAASVSLGYAGPQQVLGAPAAVTDDIYSLGATLYELLTGKPPFYEGDVLTQLREVVPPTLAARRAALGIKGREPIPVAWEETIAACLAKRADDRPQSAAEVATRLGLSLGSETQMAFPRRPARRRPRQLVGLAASILLVGLVALWITRSAPPPPTAVTAVPAKPAPAVPEFVVTVSPPDVGARVWLASATDRPVAVDGRIGLAGLPDGDHELTVQATGYSAAKLRVRVTGGTGSATVTLTPVYATLQVSARPGTVVTAVNDRGQAQVVGTVPASGVLLAAQTLVVGTYSFEFTHPSCKDVTQSATQLVASSTKRLNPKQSMRTGELRVFSVPAGADVLVNGKRQGTTPATLSALPCESEQTIDVRLPKHRSSKHSVILKPGETRSLDVGILVAEAGTLQLRLADTIRGLPDLIVKLDDQIVPHPESPIEGLEVSSHTIEVTHPDFEPWKGTVQVFDAQLTSSPVVDIKPKSAQLTFAITGPTGYTVTLNGKTVPVKDHLLTLPARETHSVVLNATGYRTSSHFVTLPPNGRKTMAITMERIPIAVPGRSWKIPDLGLTLLPVSPGSFSMGTIVGEPPVIPLTPVTLTKPYWLGRTEVTQHEWTTVMGTQPAHFRGDALPVENISWAEAVDFCRRLTEREQAAERLPPGYVYALPTEAQWEHAWRAGRPDEPTGEAGTAWHAANSGDSTHPVALLQPNPWGFHDMQGNVWEWCADRYHAKLGGESIKDPKGPGGGTARVRRGGSYVLPAALFRSAPRGSGEADYRNFNLGFRLALVPKP